MRRSFCVEEFVEVGFGEDGDAEFFGFVVFGAGIGTDDHVVGFLADGAGNFPAMLLHQFRSFFAGASSEATGENEALPGKLVALHFALFRGGMDTDSVQLFNELAVRGLGEELDNRGCDLGADFMDGLKLFLFRRS